MDTHFADVFRVATGKEPFPYQTRLAEQPTFPKLLRVPTGVGKTAAITLSWLWRRRLHSDPKLRNATPRRLVYCLPMRILVEQTRTTVAAYLEQLDLSGPNGVKVHLLLGGDADDAWLSRPEDDAILIGTQDMLLSRALNRGYGLNRFQWPQAFGLLHSDALWVFDEVQLFGVGLPTTTQFEAFRRRLGTSAPAASIWMSATLQPDWLRTADFPGPAEDEILQLNADDLASSGPLAQRLRAAKTLRRLDLKRGARDAQYGKALAAEVSRVHRSGTTTLVIVNTVDRAKSVHRALQGSAAQLLLVHSRFRPAERALLVSQLSAPPSASAGRIIVSTQVVEAGVDLSARTLFTELAPWTSLVQRFGRCNRYGEFDAADVYWLDLEDASSAPYQTEDLSDARRILLTLDGGSVAPEGLPPVGSIAAPEEVIRLRDLLDLFDTAPDLSGNDIDVSRYIRESGDHDVMLCWRDFGDAPSEDSPRPVRRELCPAPIGQVREMLKDRRAWAWSHLDGAWLSVKPNNLRPGQILLLRAQDGGYDERTGFDPKSMTPVASLETAGAPEESPGADPLSRSAEWQTLVEHTNAVVATTQRIVDRLALEEHRAALLRTARWHDAGKSHAVFQATLTKDAPDRRNLMWAKSPAHGRHSRPHFRHELASALAAMAADPDGFLVPYLVAAHHGRVRVRIRSLDGERPPTDADARFALGIWDGDRLPAADLGGGVESPPLELDLSPMDMGASDSGQPSWAEQAIRLLDAMGPFRLAYLEALVRAADVRASAGKE